MGIDVVVGLVDEVVVKVHELVYVVVLMVEVMLDVLTVPKVEELVVLVELVLLDVVV